MNWLTTFLFGIPGCGKGTQAKLLKKHHQIIHVGSGDLCVERRKKDHVFDWEWGGFMDSGRLLPDSVIDPMMSEQIALLPRQYRRTIDGWPRTPSQTLTAFQRLIERQETDGIVVVHFVGVLEDVARKRMIARGRSDDAGDLSRRFADYRNNIADVLAMFKKRGAHVYEVNASLSPDEVFSDVQRVLGLVGVEQLRYPEPSRDDVCSMVGATQPEPGCGC